VSRRTHTDYSGQSDRTETSSKSLSDAGFTNYDVYILGQVGYQFMFESWALSIDLQPKYGLINRIKSTDKFNDDNLGTGSNASDWHSLWFDLTVSFLF
jgi:hypothetical protein